MAYLKRLPWGLLVLLVGGVILFSVFFVIRAGAAVPPLPQGIDSCRSTPQFVAALTASSSLALRTDRHEMGLVLHDTADAAAPIFQHPTWDDAGYLGAIAYDRQGHVYAAPTPRLSLADNPLAGAATIWRADTTSGVLQPWVTLPGAASARNPFGVLGMFAACDLETLYVGSVLGSLPTQEHGGVIAIRLADGAQTVILRDTDSMGVLVVRQGSGYTLYVGLARRPVVLALPLDAQGNPDGEPTTLLDLTTAGATPQERASKLRLVGDALVLDMVPFTFSLQANATDVPPIRRAVWGWETATGQWVVRQAAQ